MRHVRNAGKQLPKLRIRLLHVLRKGGDPVAHLAGTQLQFRGIGAFFAQFCDLARKGVLFRAQLFGFRDGGAAATDQVL